MKNFLFNTGRLYTENGQRIAAREIKQTDNGDSIIALCDIDRGIEGFYLITFGADFEISTSDVMRAYDYDSRITWKQETEYLFDIDKYALFAELANIARKI